MTIPLSCQIPVGLKRGNKGPGVRILQEWLCLAGHLVTIDGDFGPATERALSAETLRPPVVTEEIARALTRPMSRAIAATGSVLDIARAHLAEHPREVGGQNRGPWCRLYSGENGEGRPWCADFAAHVATQAKDVWAHRISPSCDVIATRAKAEGRFSSEKPTVGGLFLVRKSSTDWTHTGFVTEVGDGWVRTIEANTNDEGSREGHEACARTRGVSKLDFVRLG